MFCLVMVLNGPGQCIRSFTIIWSAVGSTRRCNRPRFTIHFLSKHKTYLITARQHKDNMVTLLIYTVVHEASFTKTETSSGENRSSASTIVTRFARQQTKPGERPVARIDGQKYTSRAPITRVWVSDGTTMNWLHVLDKG